MSHALQTILRMFSPRRPRLWALLLLTAVVALPAAAQEAVPTQVTVRAVSNDAKLIQDPVGGAHITIEDAETGAVLAEGQQTGDSGSTDKIMRQPHQRGASIYEAPGAAKYETTLDLAEPTRVRVTAEGPLDYPQALQTASKTVTLMPGEDVTGDGITLTLHGFIVEVLSPTATDVTAGEDVAVRARVRMMCGCPTEPGGLWDANRYTIQAQLLRDGRVVAEAPLSFAGTTNEYDGTLTVPDEGATEVRVTARDAERVNFGMGTAPLTGE
jgi:hypothetical protein